MIPRGVGIVAVVLHFRTPQLTLGCLRGLHTSGVQQVVLVDNSEDGGASLSMMHDVLASFRLDGFVVDVLSPPRNLGFAAGVNFALQHILADGPACVLLLNSDAVIESEALGSMCKAIQGGCDVVAPALVDAPEAGSIQPAGYHKWTGMLTSRRVPGAMAYLSGACLLISERIARPGLFDTDFFFYGEDVELSHRLRSEGARLCWLPNARVIHPPSHSARNGSMFYEYHMVRGHWKLAVKLSRNPIGRAVGILGRLFMLPARAAIRSMRNRSIVPLKAVFLATADVVCDRPRDLTPPAASCRSAADQG